MSAEIFGWPIEFYLASAFAVLLTGISKAGFAGGLSVLAVPIMTFFVSPQLAATIMMPILVVIDIANIWRYRRDWSRRIILMIMPGAMIGLAIGAFFFEWVDARTLKILVGLLALSFAAHYFVGRLQQKPVPKGEQKVHPALVTFFGALSGLASFIAHAGSPPIKSILLKQNLEKSRFVGTNSVYFFLINALKAIAYGGLGQYSVATLSFSLSLAPFLIIGVLLGFWLHKNMSQQLFTNLAYVFLTLSGLKLVWDGLVY